MKTSEIDLGNYYAVKVSNKISPVQVLGLDTRTGRPRWRCMNLATRHEILVKSPQRFRYRIFQSANGWRRDSAEGPEARLDRE